MCKKKVFIYLVLSITGMLSPMGTGAAKAAAVSITIKLYELDGVTLIGEVVTFMVTFPGGGTPPNVAATMSGSQTFSVNPPDTDRRLTVTCTRAMGTWITIPLDAKMQTVHVII